MVQAAGARCSALKVDNLCRSLDVWITNHVARRVDQWSSGLVRSFETVDWSARYWTFLSEETPWVGQGTASAFAVGVAVVKVTGYT